MKKQIAIEELRFGMYVAELDRPWTDTRFAFQGFVLRTPEQLEELRSACRQVTIDLERGDAPAVTQGVNGSSHVSVGELRRQAGVTVVGRTHYPEQSPVDAEFVRARTIYAESVALVEESMRSLQNGGTLDGPRLHEAIARMTESVVRNPDALLLLAKLHDKGGNVLVRAIDTAIYMVVFARFLQLPKASLELLGLTGLLQDVGKVRLPAELLDKKERLNPVELKIARSHVRHSVEIVAGTAGLPAELEHLVSLHHEREDGTGYPKGLTSPQIGLHGSIAAIVDTFDALTSMRPYADQVSPSNALGLLYRERGTKFHAALVEQFIQCVGAFPVGSLVELNSGEIGVVISQNLVRRLQPRVMVVLDAKGRPMRPHKILDLIKEPKAAPGEPYRIRGTLEQNKVRIDPAELFL